MSYRHFIIGLLLLLTTFACTKKLTKSELADVLVDMYIYDQLFMRANLRNQQDSISVYRSVFQKHKCTEKQFKASINYYGDRPKRLKEVYAEADAKIKSLKESYGNVVEIQRKEKALQMKMDSLYRYPQDTFYRYIFNRCLLWDMEFTMEASRPAAVNDTTGINTTMESVEEDAVMEVPVSEETPVKRVMDENAIKVTGKKTRLNRKPMLDKEAVKIESTKVN